MTDKALLKKLDDLTEAMKSSTPAPVAHPGDHDLLLRIDTKVERVILDVQKINDNFAHRIDMLETDKVSKTDNDKVQQDHEDRIRKTEKFQENLIGKISVITVIISIVIVLITTWLKAKFGL